MRIFDGIRFRPTAAALILALAVALRLIGAAVNFQANDDHMDVVQIIAHEHRIPADGEAWEAFQPKLYHVTVAAVLTVLPAMGESKEIVVGQAVSCVAGILTLLILRAFLWELPLSARTRLISFALVALNPKMISTSIQATNDAFVILFGAAAIAAGYRFFRTYARRDFIVMTGAAVLAGLSKGTGLALVLAVACTFAAALLKPAIPRVRIVSYAATFIAISSVLILSLGGYLSRYLHGQSMFAINLQLYGSPLGTALNRPGITSVANSYFTFRLADMLEHPVITVWQDDYPQHRTSLWSFVYGSAHSIHYDPLWSWQSQNPVVLGLLRVVWILALLPSLLLVIGMVRGVLQSARTALSRVASRTSSADVLLAATAMGYIAFLIKFSYQYQDFGTMKPIYIYPAMAAFLAYFAREFDRLLVNGGGLLSRLVYASAALLCVAYVADVAILLVHLRECAYTLCDTR